MPDPKQARLGNAFKGAGLTGGALAAAFAAASLIMPAEGKRNTTYLDPVAIPTDCYGHTGKDVKVGQTRTDDQCLDLLAQDVVAHENGVTACITRPLAVPVQAAFTSFAYNAGVAKFCASTMAKKANAGDIRGACDELPKWVYAGGHKLPGLVTRRAAERAYCLRGL